MTTPSRVRYQWRDYSDRRISMQAAVRALRQIRASTVAARASDLAQTERVAGRLWTVRWRVDPSAGTEYVDAKTREQRGGVEFPRLQLKHY
jgi:hypothetical protein